MIVDSISTNQFIIIIPFAYLIGIIGNEFGHTLYNISKKIWKKDVINQKNYRLSDAEIHVLIREYSPNNYQFLETWLGLSNMSHNFAVSLLIFSIVASIKLFSCSDSYCFLGWILIMVICFLFTIIFLKRSLKFNNYYKFDRIAAIEKLHIEKQAENGAKKNE